MQINIPSPSVKWGVILILYALHVGLSTVGDGMYKGGLAILIALLAGWFLGSFTGAGVVVGLIAIHWMIFRIANLEYPYFFSLYDFTLGTLLLMGLAIAAGWLNARMSSQIEQDTQLKNQLKEAGALSNISIALSQTERVGLANILQLIVDSAKNLIPTAEQAVIHILDDEKKYLIAKAVTGYEQAPERRLQMKLGEGIAGQAIITGETINITDISTDARFIKSASNTIKFRSLLVTPIVSGTEKLGTISIQSRFPNAFTKHEQELLNSLSVQAAIAIENAKLLENTQKSLRETNALYRINQGLMALNADELLEDVVTLLEKNFGYYHVQVFILDAPTGNLVLKAASGQAGKKLLENKFTLRAGEGIVGYAAETLLPFFTNNVDDVVFYIYTPILPDTKSEMAVPLKIGERLFGVLDIQQALPKTFTGSDLQLINAVADQLAISMQKADLFETVQKSLQQEKSMRSQLIQNERLAAIGRLLASVSHELNNPLQAIQNALFLLKEEKGISEQGKQDLDIVLAESERMAEMIERLRDTYRPIRVEDFKPTQINNLIEDIYALVGSHLKHKLIAFEFIPDTDILPIPALADQLRQAFLNLVINAIEAMPHGGKLTILTELLEETHEVRINISDTGKGISPEVMPQIFEAFNTDKETGTGLGLTITYDIIVKHNGHIKAKNNISDGATFSIWLPTKRLELT